MWAASVQAAVERGEMLWKQAAIQWWTSIDGGDYSHTEAETKWKDRLYILFSALVCMLCKRPGGYSLEGACS